MTSLKSDSLCPYCRESVRWWHRREERDGRRYHRECAETQDAAEVREAQARVQRREDRQRRRKEKHP